MSDGHVFDDEVSASEASRPAHDMRIGLEVGEVFTHMLGDVDPASTRRQESGPPK